VNKDRAAQVDRIIREASQLLDDSVGPVRAVCTEKATSVYRSAIGRAMGDMAAGLLFPLWREHPALAPEGLGETGSYNAREFQMPVAVAEQALATLAQARELVEQVRSVIATEPDASERQAYQAELERVFEAIDAAVRGVERRKVSA
jgi:hypothetical protein